MPCPFLPVFLWLVLPMYGVPYMLPCVPIGYKVEVTFHRIAGFAVKGVPLFSADIRLTILARVHIHQQPPGQFLPWP